MVSMNHWARLETKNYVDLIELREIDASFKLHSVVLLTGLPGAGKTTLASRYAQHFARKPDSVVVWLHAEEPCQLSDGFQELLMDLKVGRERLKSMSDKAKVEAVCSGIKARSHQHLIVFDDIGSEQIDVVKILAHSLPLNLKVILTAQSPAVNDECQIELNVFQLPKFGAIQVKQYLADTVGKQFPSAVVERLYADVFKGELTPYQLVSMVAAVEEAGLTPGAVDSTIDELKGFDVPKSMIKKAKQTPECKDFLNTISFLDPDEIAVDILPVMGGTGPVMETLERVALVRRLPGVVQVPRPVLNALQRKLRDHTEKSAKIRRKIVAALNETLTDINDRQRCLEVHPHLLRIFGRGEAASLKETELLDKLIAIEEKYKANWRNAVHFKRMKVDSLRRIYEHQSDHRSLAAALSGLGRSLCELGNYAAAIESLQEALEMRRRIYKDQPDHLKIASTLNQLGSTFSESGDHERAIKLLTEALEIYQKAKPVDDPIEFVECLGNLGFSYSETGSQKKAITYLKRALEIERLVYEKEPDHPFIANSLSVLGLAYRRVGDHAEAIKYFSEALEKLRTIHADQPDHQDIATSLNNLACSYSELGDVGAERKAIAYYTEALEIYRRVYKEQPDHANVAISLVNLGLLYSDSGEHARAITCLSEALRIRRRIYQQEPDHPILALTLRNLALVHRRCGEHDKAVRFYSKQLEMLRRLHQEETPELAAAIGDLALTYSDQGDEAKATSLYIEALEVLRRLKVDKPDKSTLARILFDLSFLYNKIGERDKANAAHVEALNAGEPMETTTNALTQ